VRTVYACELGFEDPPVDAFDRVVEATARWVGSFHADRDGTLLSAEAGRWAPEPGVQVTWERDGTADGSAFLWALSWCRPDPEDQDARWVTEVQAARTPERCEAAVRISRERRGGGVGPATSRFPRPVLVNTLLGSLRATADGRRLRDEAEVVPASRADALAELLLRPDRRLPVVAITNSFGADAPAAHPGRLAQLLAGLAHVFRLRDRPATLALTERLGDKRLSVYGGAVRLWWPGFDRAAEPRAHPLFLEGHIREMAEEGLDLAERLLLELAAAHAEVPPLRAIRAEVRAALGSERKRRRQALKEAVGSDWHAELERCLRSEEALRAEVADLRSRLAAAEAARAAPPAPQAPPPTTEEPRISSVRAAVEAAREECRHLVFLEDALESASKSPYEQPHRALEALRRLDEVARRYRDRDLGGGFKAAFQDVGLHYRSDVSPTARGLYPDQYRRTWNGRTIWLGPHIALGAGTPRTCLRIYFAVDEETRTIVVGHVGNHLRDTTTG
jgi:hypothetical protein